MHETALIKRLLENVMENARDHFLKCRSSCVDKDGSITLYGCGY